MSRVNAPAQQMRAAQRAGIILVFALYGLTLFLAAPAWPDDWDGIGFLLAIRHFDLATFQPHPPGYPVYIALLRLAAHVADEPMGAAALVAAASGVATVFFAWRSLITLAGRGSWATAVFLAVTPMVVHASTGVGSEAPALAFYALAAWGCVTPRRLPKTEWKIGALVGAAVAFGLGTRLSWLPLYVPLLIFVPSGRRLAAFAALVVGCLAWLVPLAICSGGFGALAHLVRAHAEGHFTRWGGAELTDPGPERVLLFGRDLFVDGLGAGTDVFGVALGLAFVVLALVGLPEYREAGFAHAGRAAILFGPYALWVLLGQNVREQPRHLLPLVALCALLIGETIRKVPRIRTLGVGLVIILAARASIDADQRATIAPSMVQLVKIIDGKAGAERAVVATGTSARFGDILPHHARIVPAATWGDVRQGIGRLDNLPSRIVVTSEIKAAAGEPLPKRVSVGNYCRPARLDRRAPCLYASEISLDF